MNYYNEIKKELINNEVYKRVKDYSKNKYELEKYYNVGKLLVEAQGGEARAKYGDGLIKEYSMRLSRELGKGYTISALKRMRQFYEVMQKGATMSHLSWSHYVEILKLDDISKINYYIDVTEKYNLSVRELRFKIKSCEYERIDIATRRKLLTSEVRTINDDIKHPIIIRNKYDTEEISEKMLKGLILNDMDNFLNEFGQIQVYMNYIDRHIKDNNHNETIRIIVSRYNNGFALEYSSDERIYETTYLLTKNNCFK